MEHLIKQYSLVLGELIHLKRIFPNSLFCFHQLSNLTLQHFDPEYPDNLKTNRINNFVGFFLCPNPLLKYQQK